MNIPEDNFAYPVLIKLCKGGTGSGFQLRTGKKMFLITARHVLYTDKLVLKAEQMELICQTKDLNDDSVTRYLVNLSETKTMFHPNADVAAVEISEVIEVEGKGRQLKPVVGVEILESGKTPTVSADAQTSVSLLKDVSISSDVFVYGYPRSLGLQDSPQFDYEKPLLRRGVVANIYKPAGTIILDCPVYYGNSGGPVVERRNLGLEVQHKLIGVVSQFIPFVEDWVNTKNGLTNREMSNSGYSVAVSMDKVFELIGYDPESV